MPAVAVLASPPIDPVEAARELLARRRARAYLLPFVHYTFPGYQDSPHLAQLASALEAIEQRKLTRLMVFMPPRHGKTEQAAVRFPAWYLGKHPEHQVIGCSYAESLAYANSWAVLNLIRSEEYRMLWAHDLEIEGAVRWMLRGKSNRRASFVAAGVGGGITGEGADLLVIDDPVKNQEEADSQTIREKHWAWWTHVARTRLQPDAVVVLIMTRWHEDDLAGRLLKQAAADPKADQWTVLHLPALTDGAALWTERYDVAALENIRSTIGGRAFEALYQGNPTAAEGNIIKREWLKFYPMRPEFKRLVQSWDTAFKEDSSNDYSVCQLWGEAENGYYLVDSWRERVAFPELVQTLKAAYERDHPQAVLVEDAASGQSLLQVIQKETKFPVLAVKADRDKVARVNAVTPLFEAGRVFLPQSAHWLFDYMAELASFPQGEHDDQVDATSQALAYLAGRKEPQILWV